MDGKTRGKRVEKKRRRHNRRTNDDVNKIRVSTCVAISRVYDKPPRNNHRRGDFKKDGARRYKLIVPPCLSLAENQ